MKLKQFVISIENSQDRLFEVTDALGSAGINLRALNLVDTGAFGQLRLIVSDVKKARSILMKLNIPAYENEVVLAKIPDKPNSLSKLLKKIADEGLQIVFMYAFTGLLNDDYAVMIFRFNDKAIEVLRKNKITLIDDKEFGIISS
jgi:hypothetical protein